MHILDLITYTLITIISLASHCSDIHVCCPSILCKQRSVMSAAAHLDNVADHWQKIGHCFTRSWWGHQASDRLSNRVSMIFLTRFSDSTLWRVDLDSKTPKDSQGLPRTPALSTPVARNPSLQIERQVFIILYPQPICLGQVFIAKFVPLRKKCWHLNRAWSLSIHNSRLPKTHTDRCWGIAPVSAPTMLRRIAGLSWTQRASAFDLRGPWDGGSFKTSKSWAQKYPNEPNE